MNTNKNNEVFVFLASIIIMTCFSGYITHIVWCIHHNSFLFLIASCIVAPIGVFHGIGLWFGIF